MATLQTLTAKTADTTPLPVQVVFLSTPAGFVPATTELDANGNQFTTANPKPVADASAALTASAIGAQADSAYVSGSGGVIALLKGIFGKLAGVLSIVRPPLTYSAALGSPFTLAPAWVKVATTTVTTKGLRIAPISTASAYDIEWIAVTAGASAPTDTYGEPILGGEDFTAGLPIGDIYLKSASGQVAIVKTGV